MVAVLAVAFPGWPSPLASEPEPPINIGSRLELLLGDALIDSMRDLEFELHSPRPAEQILTFDAPWEGVYCDYVTVFEDGGRYRMYYSSHLDAPRTFGGPNQLTSYAESRDGVHWTRPKLGMVEFDGSKANNIILRGETSHNFSPFIDGRPGVPENERYKAVGGLRVPYVFASADAIHWRRLRDDPILTPEHPAFEHHGVALWGKPIPRYAVFDSQNIAFWDDARGHYAFYFRAWLPASEADRAEKGDIIRSIFRSTSLDFLNWSDPEPLDFGDAPSEHLYTSATIPYFRAPHLLLAFPMRYVTSRDPPVKALRRGFCDALFMFSRDGRRFSRRHAEAFIRPGPEPLNWTKHSIMPAWGLLQTADDEISIYYSQHYYAESNHLIRGVMRLDGFVSLRAPYAGGEFTTKPLVFSGNRLVINAATSAAGGIRCEIQDADGKPLDGHRLQDAVVFYGDTTAHTFRWKGGTDIGSLEGKTVRLRVEMNDSDLYSLRFSSEEQQSP
ncbi:MAG: hypothetical protein CMJ81_10870 [Planctomycetaceae bacterium]|nr:hypothetical protein [Planctomycetaceae bacterium]